jgi:diguanylate cyclase (GGDEF)-like protein
MTERNMTDNSASICASDVLELCPFSFILDAAGRISALGSYYARRHPEMYGLQFEEAFALVGGGARTRQCLDNPGAFRSSAAELKERVELQLREGDGLKVVGAFFQMVERQSGLIFIGTVSPQSISQVIDLGLTVSDFAPFDTSADFVMMAQVNEAVLKDTRRLNERYAAARNVAVAAHRRLESVALVDALSGLGNRLAFQRALNSCASQANPQRPYCLMLLDIDDFKPVNDQHGHAIGDLLIRSIGERMKRGIDRNMQAFRIGGDEFAVLCPWTTPEEARRRADHVLQQLNVPHVIHGKTIEVTTSVGIAGRLPGTNDAERVYKAADIALYAAKRSSSDKLKVFTPAMGRQELDRKLLERDLVEAIETRQLHVDVQPLFDLQTGRLWGGEALARWWNRRLQRFVPPAEFIPIAEEYRLIAKIDLFVLEQMLAAQKAFCNGSRQLSWSTNLSALTLGMPDLLSRLRELRARFGVPCCPVELEITESAIFPNGSATADLLKSMRDMKLGIAIDDFGAGQTSIAHLTALPISRLKLDRSLLDSIDSDARSEKIVGSIVALARQLGLRVTAEGIERASQASKLRRMGPILVQGYLYARPMPLPDYLAYLRSYSSTPPDEQAVAS